MGPIWNASLEGLFLHRMNATAWANTMQHKHPILLMSSSMYGQINFYASL